MKYIYLFLAVAFNVGAYVVFKSISQNERNLTWGIFFAVGLALGGINTFFFTSAMREISLSTAYPIFAGSSIALIVLLSSTLFKETMSLPNFAGALLVALGIVLLTR